MLPSWCTDAVTVERAPLVTTNGRTERDWAIAQTHVVGGCSVQTTNTNANLADPSAVAGVDVTLYAPPAADIADGDRITWGGRQFVIDGVPYAWTSPTGRVSHVQARLVAWAG